MLVRFGSTGYRRWLPLAGVVLALGGTCASAAWRAEVLRSRAEAISASEALSGARRLIAVLPELRDSLAARREALTMYTAALERASSAADAASRLSAVIGRFATDAGVLLGTVTVLPDSSADPHFSRPRIRANASGDITGLTQLLVLLEGETSFTRVVSLALVPADPAGAGPIEELRFTLVVEGLARVEPRSSRGDGS